MLNFTSRMYLFRYLKGLAADYVALGFPLCQSHDIAVILLPKSDFVDIAEGKFEELSPACTAFMRHVIRSRKSNKHFRFTFGSKDLQFLARSLGNTELEPICSADEFAELVADCRQYVNQNNRGYAFERVVYAMFGREWSWKNKGCDLVGVELNGETVNVEIKFYNGQAKK